MDYRIQRFFLTETFFAVLLAGKANLRIPDALIGKPAHQVISCLSQVLGGLKDITRKIKLSDADIMRLSVIRKQQVVIIFKTAVCRDHAAFERFFIRPADIEGSIQMQM